MVLEHTVFLPAASTPMNTGEGWRPGAKDASLELFTISRAWPIELCLAQMFGFFFSRTLEPPHRSEVFPFEFFFGSFLFGSLGSNPGPPLSYQARDTLFPMDVLRTVQADAARRRVRSVGSGRVLFWKTRLFVVCKGNEKEKHHFGALLRVP